MSRLLSESELNVEDDVLCDRLSVREMSRLSQIDWEAQIERRRAALLRNAAEVNAIVNGGSGHGQQ